LKVFICNSLNGETAHFVSHKVSTHDEIAHYFKVGEEERNIEPSNDHFFNYKTEN